MAVEGGERGGVANANRGGDSLVSGGLLKFTDVGTVMRLQEEEEVVAEVR